MKIALLTLILAAPLLTFAQKVDQVEANKALIRQHHDHMSRGDWKAALQNYAPDTKNHGRPVGREGLQRVLQDIFTTFPDWRMEILDMVAEKESVVVQCTVSGTHKGVGKLPINGAMLVDVQPTGKHFEVLHIHWYILKDGKIVDHRANRDDIGMTRQLGLLPPAPQSAAPK
jgi:predicted ester cyclase